MDESQSPAVQAALDAGNSAAARDDLTRAEAAFFEAVRRAEMIGGEPLLAAVVNLGVTKIRQSRVAEARPYLERALTLAESLFEPDDPRTGDILVKLAGVCTQAGEHGSAAHHYERVLPVWEHAFGESHPNIAVVLHNLGASKLRLSVPAEAEPLLARAVELRERLGQAPYPVIDSTLMMLATCYRLQRKWEQARVALVKCWSLRMKALGGNDLACGEVLLTLGAVCLEEGNPEDAEEYYRFGAGVCQKNGNEAWLLSAIRGRLAALRALGRDSEAFELEQRHFGSPSDVLVRDKSQLSQIDSFALASGRISVPVPSGNGWELQQMEQNVSGVPMAAVKFKRAPSDGLFFLMAKTYQVAEEQMLNAEQLSKGPFRQNHLKTFSWVNVEHEHYITHQQHGGYESWLRMTHAQYGEILKCERVLTKGDLVFIISAEGQAPLWNVHRPSVDLWLNGVEFAALDAGVSVS